MAAGLVSLVFSSPAYAEVKCTDWVKDVKTCTYFGPKGNALQILKQFRDKETKELYKETHDLDADGKPEFTCIKVYNKRGKDIGHDIYDEFSRVIKKVCDHNRNGRVDVVSEYLYDVKGEMMEKSVDYRADGVDWIARLKDCKIYATWTPEQGWKYLQ